MTLCTNCNRREAHGGQYCAVCGALSDDDPNSGLHKTETFDAINDVLTRKLKYIEQLEGELSEERAAKDRFARVSMGAIYDFSKESGAMEVWQTWVTTMSQQGRDVPPHRREWSTLPELDKQLDTKIAWMVITRFYEYLIRVWS
jgi:hypothetical protein